MSNVFFILLLAVGFAGWKALDYFQLPNTFSILLLILTALSFFKVSLIKNKNPKLFSSGFTFSTWRCPTLTWGSPTLPSAHRRFTSEFGMGSGGTTALSPPGLFL